MTETESMHTMFSRLRVNGLAAPLGVSSATLQLAWIAGDAVRPDDEILLEIGEHLGLKSGASLHVLPSHARSLVLPRPDARCTLWRVGLRRAGHLDWSEAQRIVTAPDFDELGAHWVAHPALAERRPAGDDRSVWFSIPIESRPHDSVTLLHLAAPAVAEVRVDGEVLGDRLLGPGYSALAHEASAVTYDLGVLTPGPHVVTIELASGPYWISDVDDRYKKFSAHHQPPSLIAAVEQCGTTTRVTPTEPGRTRAGRGATTSAHWYGGEDYDAALPEPWQQSESTTAVAAGLAPTSIWWPEHPPLAVVETLEPVSSRAVSDGRLLEFGVNIAGIPGMRWAPSLTDRVIELYPAELLRPDGVDQDSTGSPIVDRVRIPAGTAGAWSPRFGYHGFRYLELRGDTVGVDASARVIRATNRSAGRFTSGDPFLQRLHDVIDRAVQGNMYSVFTDCPHREKLGWLEQLHFCFDAITRGYDVEAHLRDMIHHARTAQLPSGAIPNTVPEFVDFSGHSYLGDDEAFRFDVNWGGVIVHLPLAHYREYGDARVLEDNAEAMKAYLGYLESREVDGLIDFGLGDWIAIDASAPRELVASHGYLRVLESAHEVAGLMHEATWAEHLRDRIERLSRALRRLHVPTVDSSQTELALLTDLAVRRGDADGADATFALLLDRVAADGERFTVGEVTFALLVDLLHRRGHADLVYRTISRADVPGYGMQLARGVTALAETWSAERLAVGEGSNNHFMLGMIDHWLQNDVAGLRQKPGSIAWRSAVVAPTFLNGVPSAASVYQSPSGTYRVAWRREGQDVAVDVEIPADGRALVVIPGIPTHEIGPGSYVYQSTNSSTPERIIEEATRG